MSQRLPGLRTQYRRGKCLTCALALVYMGANATGHEVLGIAFLAMYVTALLMTLEFRQWVCEAELEAA